MSYDFDQVEQISQTVFAYERGDPQHMNPPRILMAVDTLLTGTPHRVLAWTLNAKLGANPTLLNRRSAVDGHCIDFAAAYADYPELQANFLDYLKRKIEEDDSVVGMYSNPYVPGPRSPDLRFDKGCTKLFHPQHASWYTPKALVKLASDQLQYQTGIGRYLRDTAFALAQHGESAEMLRDIATTAVTNALKKKATATTDFVGIADAIALADQGRVEETLLKCNGVYRILLVTLHRSTSKGMVAGLKALSSSKRLELLRCMGRTPTAQELLDSNVKGAANVWRFMPWELLAPVVREHGVALRGGLLKHELPVELLRQCLIDHSDRYFKGALGRATAEAPRGYEEWTAFAKGLQRYFAAIRVRETVLEHFPTEVARLIMFRHVTGRDDLAKFVDHLLPEPVRHALASYVPPLVLGKGGKDWIEVIP
jgi:hypothetical protein